MSFKGKYSILRSRCSGKGIDFSKIDSEYHLDLGNIFNRQYGWVKSKQIILELTNPLEHYDPSSINPETKCSDTIKQDKSGLFDEVCEKLNGFKKPDEGPTALSENIIGIKVCRYNPRLVLVEFEDENDDFLHDKIQSFGNEEGVTGGGNPTSGHESGYLLPNGSYGPAPGVLKYTDKIFPALPVGESFEDCNIVNVGIVDRGLYASCETFYHVDILKRIIEHEGHVGVVNMPMVDDPEAEATTFDMICALSNPEWLSQVDVINISQGIYATVPHPLLQRTLACLNKIVVCSAGNINLDNDLDGHWPSNFSLIMDHVIAVANLGLDSRLHQSSNHGGDTVTLAATGEFTHDTNTIFGTSFSTAWISRMIALAFSLTGRTNLTLSEVIDKVLEYYQGSFNNPDDTVTKIRITTSRNPPPEI